MQAFTQLDGLVAPLARANVDTDAIIPKQYLKSIKRTGFGPNLFDEWRYLDPGQLDTEHSQRRVNPEFVLNQARYQAAEILLTRENFGCGSSREHAAWALLDYGFRCIISISYADIFYNNCFKNGILPIVLHQHIIDYLFIQVDNQPGYRLKVDLPNQRVLLPLAAEHTGPIKAEQTFDVAPFHKHCLVNGLDDIGLTLKQSARIKSYEQNRKIEAPWLFEDRA